MQVSLILLQVHPYSFFALRILNLLNSFSGAITKEQEDGFKNFITLAILNYANWARSNGTNELFIESPVNIESRAGMAEYNAEFW